MSAVSRYISLTAIVALVGIAAAAEVKGPVHVSARGVTHYDGDTARFHADMDASKRRGPALAGDMHIEVRRVAETARADARRAVAIARAEVRVAAETGRRIAREAAREARDAARKAAREARDAARLAAREARIHVARAMADSEAAVRDARKRLAEARRDLNERRRTLEDRRDDAREGRWDNMVEIRDGKVVRCLDPAKYPGTGCTPFTPEEKARIEAETHAAGARARAALEKAEAGLRAAERALIDETNP